MRRSSRKAAPEDGQKPKESTMIEVNTREYEFAHGNNPRGYGHWAFFFDRSTEPYWVEGRYTDAKKAAVKEARRLGFRFVRVGS
jgi:hypothetical protein